MVRRGVMFSLRDASCCRVEVVKEAMASAASARFTLLTVKGWACTSRQISWVSASEAGSYFFPFLP